MFHTLLHPSGVGGLTPALFRAARRLGHRGGGRLLDLVAPSSIVASIVMWSVMLVVGWALVYWPHLPEQFQTMEGVPARTQGSVLDAVYVSGVTLTTLGYGDVVADETPLRLLLVAEALIGFALLSASITWALSVYPALARRRTLGARIRLLLEGDGADARLAPGHDPRALAGVLHQVAEQIATARVDLMQYPATYFFDAPADDVSLPSALARLRTALHGDLPGELDAAAETVRTSIVALGETLRQGPFGLEASDAEEALSAYAADHRG